MSFLSLLGLTNEANSNKDLFEKFMVNLDFIRIEIFEAIFSAEPETLISGRSSLKLAYQWKKYLSTYDITLRASRERNSLEYVASDGAYLYFIISSILISCIDALMQMKPRIVLPSTKGLYELLQEEGFVVQKIGGNLHIPMKYGSTMDRNLYPAKDHVIDQATKIYFSYGILADLLYKRGEVTHNFKHLQVSHRNENKDIKKMTQSLAAAAAKAAREEEQRVLEREQLMSPTTKNKCAERQERCSYQPLLTDNWCDVPTENFHDIGRSGKQLCFDIVELLSHIESQLATTKMSNPYPIPPSDWNNRQPFTFDELIEMSDHAQRLGIEHEYPLFGKYVHAITKGLIEPEFLDGNDWRTDDIMYKVIDILYDGVERQH